MEGHRPGRRVRRQRRLAGLADVFWIPKHARARPDERPPVTAGVANRERRLDDRTGVQGTDGECRLGRAGGQPVDEAAALPGRAAWHVDHTIAQRPKRDLAERVALPRGGGGHAESLCRGRVGHDDAWTRIARCLLGGRGLPVAWQHGAERGPGEPASQQAQEAAPTAPSG